MKDYVFVGCKLGTGKNSGKPYYALWLGLKDGASVGYSVWETFFIDEEEYSEFACCKFGDIVTANIKNGVLKSYEINHKK